MDELAGGLEGVLVPELAPGLELVLVLALGPELVLGPGPGLVP